MGKIKTLSLDLETYSSVDLAKCGVYKYAESPDFEILLFAYSVNEGSVGVVDVARGDEVPKEILAALTDDAVEKWAYNAQFERVCLSNWLRRNHPRYFSSYSIPEDSVGGYLDPEAWKCSRVWGAYMGLPLSLKGVGAVLKLGGTGGCTAAVYINGEKAKGIDFDNPEVDITDLVKPGENTVVVEVSSTLANRLRARGYYSGLPMRFMQLMSENTAFGEMGGSNESEGEGGAGGLFGGKLTQCDVQEYGLTGETCVAFYAVKAI